MRPVGTHSNPQSSYKDYFRLKTFEIQQIQGEKCLLGVYLTKMRAAINSLFGVVQLPGDRPRANMPSIPSPGKLYGSKTERLRLCINKHDYKLSYLMSVLLKAHLSFLKPICFSTETLSPCSLSTMKSAYKPLSLAVWRSSSSECFPHTK